MKVLIITVGIVFYSQLLWSTTSRIAVKHIEERGIGYDKGYSSLDGYLMPNWDRKFLPFANARGHIFNDGKWASNIGIGGRFAPHDNWVYGLNTYYDFRSATTLRGHQMGVGLEALSRLFDLRINGYVPIAIKHRASPFRFNKFIKNPFGAGSFVRLKRNVVMDFASIFGEIGFSLIPEISPIDLYFACGPYYLAQEKFSSVKCGGTWGAHGRLAMRILDGIEVAVKSSYDKEFHGIIQGYVSLGYPFVPSNMRLKGQRWRDRRGHLPHPRLRRRMTQDVWRNEIIPMCSKRERPIPTRNAGLVFNFNEILNNPSVEPVTLIFVNNVFGSSDGSHNNPFRTIAQAVAVSKPNDFVYIAATGKPYQPTSTIVLQEGQVLQSNGSVVMFNGRKLLRKQSASNAALDGTLIGGPSPTVIVELVTNTQIKAMTFSGADIGAANTTPVTNISVEGVFKTKESGVVIENGYGSIIMGTTNNNFSNSMTDYMFKCAGKDMAFCVENSTLLGTPSSTVGGGIEVTDEGNNTIMISGNRFDPLGVSDAVFKLVRPATASKPSTCAVVYNIFSANSPASLDIISVENLQGDLDFCSNVNSFSPAATGRAFNFLNGSSATNASTTSISHINDLLFFGSKLNYVNSYTGNPSALNSMAVTPLNIGSSKFSFENDASNSPQNFQLISPSTTLKGFQNFAGGGSSSFTYTPNSDQFEVVSQSLQ